MLPKIKSKAFIQLLPKILELREQGFSYEEVAAILEKDYGLILSVKQFSVYLARYKNAQAPQAEKQAAAAPVKQAVHKDESDPAASDSSAPDHGFLSPEHKAKVEEETMKYFSKPKGIGIRNK